MNTVELKNAPELKQIIKTAFGDYRKRVAFLSEFPSGGIFVNSYWNDGSKDVYAIVELATMTVRYLSTPSHPSFDMHNANGENSDVIAENGNVRLKRLPVNYALVGGGIFCGRPAIANIYLNPENLAKLLCAESSR